MYLLYLFAYFRQVTLHTGDKARCSKFSTSGVDGKLCIWDLGVRHSLIYEAVDKPTRNHTNLKIYEIEMLV